VAWLLLYAEVRMTKTGSPRAIVSSAGFRSAGGVAICRFPQGTIAVS
jgi:hypothetical protein